MCRGPTSDFAQVGLTGVFTWAILMSSTTAGRGRVLLASASSGGTIAAARHLAANGFDVRVLSSERLAAARWSRSVSHSHRCPSEIESDQFLSQLLALGKADPGQILLPTSDQTTWLYSAYSGLLENYFRLYQPPIPVLRRLLDKKLLGEAAANVAVPSPRIWDPDNVAELSALASELPYPILLKPRTHVYGVVSERGVVVDRSDALLPMYQRFLVRNENRGGEKYPFPDAAKPILQEYVDVGNEGVHSIAGFIDRGGELYVTRRSRKVFKRAPHVGVGVCYESLPADASLSRYVRALCHELGYFGMFEVEFVPFKGGWAVIDFNPRLYNQVGLDISRGLPLPTLACLGAVSDIAQLTDAAARAESAIDPTNMVLYDRFTLSAMLVAMYMTSRISREDLAYWRSWARRNAGRSIDVAVCREDPMPGIIHAISEIYLGIKAAPRFFNASPRVLTAT